MNESFDARAAIEALNRDVVRLTNLFATQVGAITPPLQMAPQPPTPPPSASATPLAPVPGTRSIPAENSPTGVGPSDEEDSRVKEMVDATPAPRQEEMRKFARLITEQGDINRGVRPPETPDELRRIIGGENVPPGGYLSCVCLGDATRWFCSGVLVAPRVVLTAAHCGNNITRVMVAGNTVPLLERNSLVLSVQSVTVHPNYVPAHNENDITVVVLSQPALVPPVLLATAEQLSNANTVQLVGFGYNDPTRPLGFGTKRYVSAPLSPAVSLPATSEPSALETQLGFHAAYEFVAGRKALGRDTCMGDSGGPAYLQTNTGPILAGLTSRATRNSSLPCGDGGVYVRPDKFLDWINGVIASAGLAVLH
jgi:endonuclease G